MNTKLIADIRYYEDCLEERPIYPVPRFASQIGARYSCKLREYSFQTKEYDHIYLKFTPHLTDGTAEISSFRPEKWHIYVNYGLSPESFLQMDDEQKYVFFVKSTTDALELLCHHDDLDFELVKKVEAEILKYKTELEITHKVKETSKYRVKVSYQIRPNDNSSVAFVEYWDKKLDLRSRKKLITLKSYTDIFFLVSSVSVKNNIIVMHPRQSFLAEMYTRDYQIPLQVRIDEAI